MIKRFGKELLYLSMTMGGIGLVLITLTDQVLKYAIAISLASLFCHLVGVGIDYFNDKKHGS
jgi:hypothetical protein